MLATHGSVAGFTASQWAFEGKSDTGSWSRPTTAGPGCRPAAVGTSPPTIPSLTPLAAALADHHAVLDGELVALDDSGVPSFGRDASSGRERPGSSSGRSTCCSSTAGRCFERLPRPPSPAGDAGRRRR